MGRAYDLIKTEQDLSYLSWNEHDSPSGLSGARPKAREGLGPHAVYYKRSHAGDEASGRDCFAELICSRLARYLGVESAPTQLVRAKASAEAGAQWIIRSKSYRHPDERGIPLSIFYELCGEQDETTLDFCLRMGWESDVANIALLDYLTATRSRDASCFEVLCDKEGAYRLSPYLPRGFSLANAFPGQTWRIFATTDLNTTNYLGSSSLEENLSLVPITRKLPKADKRLKESLFSGLNDIEPVPLFIEASWLIIQGRWKRFESLRNL